MTLVQTLFEAAWLIAKYFVLLPFAFLCGVMLLGWIFSDVCKCGDKS